jgi:hypothetical protein
VVDFACDQLPPFPVDLETGKLVYSLRYHTADAEMEDKLFRFGDYFVHRYGWGADFYIGHNHIDCHLRNPANQELVEFYLLGPELAFWLEWQGVPALHASAVSIANRAVAFLSHSGNGKSTLAAGFLKAEAALLTDDILPIEDQAGQFWGRPGLPQIKLWPDQAAYFLENDNEGFEKVNFHRSKKRVPVEEFKNGAFCHESLPLACIYIPGKSEGPSNGTNMEIIPVPPAEALIELVRYSFIPPDICERLGWQAPRLDFFSRLVKQVPVRRLLYPAGFEHLPRVTEAVLQDLKNLTSQP